MKTHTRIAWIFLSLVALVHFYRVITQLPVIVNGYEIPTSISWLAFMVLAVLLVGMWRETKSRS